MARAVDSWQYKNIWPFPHIYSPLQFAFSQSLDHAKTCPWISTKNGCNKTIRIMGAYFSCYTIHDLPSPHVSACSTDLAPASSYTASETAHKQYPCLLPTHACFCLRTLYSPDILIRVYDVASPGATAPLPTNKNTKRWWRFIQGRERERRLRRRLRWRRKRMTKRRVQKEMQAIGEYVPTSAWLPYFHTINLTELSCLPYCTKKRTDGYIGFVRE